MKGGRPGRGMVSAGGSGRARGVSRGIQPVYHTPAHSRTHMGATKTPTAPAADGSAARVLSTLAQAAPSQAASAPRMTTVGHAVVKMEQRALSNVGLIFNQLWTPCGCEACVRYDVQAYVSARTYSAANLLVSKMERNRTSENTESGLEKVPDLRHPTLPDKDRRALSETTFLQPSTTTKIQKAVQMDGLSFLSFSLEARGAMKLP